MKSAEGMRILPLEHLESRGYGVVTAADGAAACDVYARQKNTIDALITDRDMPGINGGQWIHTLHRVNPSVRNVMFPRTVDRWTEPKDSLMAVSVLKEPFTPTQLLQTLKNLCLPSNKP